MPKGRVNGWITCCRPPASVCWPTTCGLYPVRTDLDGARTGSQLQRQLGAAARPIALGPGLMAPLDQSRRAAFLKRWHGAFTAAR